MPEEEDMSDTDVAGGLPPQPSEGELFREALDSPRTTLEQFENPKPPGEPPLRPEKPELTERQRDDQGRFLKTERPDQSGESQIPEGRIPSGRLREESEARRRAEQ